MFPVPQWESGLSPCCVDKGGGDGGAGGAGGAQNIWFQYRYGAAECRGLELLSVNTRRMQLF